MQVFIRSVRVGLVAAALLAVAVSIPWLLWSSGGQGHAVRAAEGLRADADERAGDAVSVEVEDRGDAVEGASVSRASAEAAAVAGLVVRDAAGRAVAGAQVSFDVTSWLAEEYSITRVRGLFADGEHAAAMGAERERCVTAVDGSVDCEWPPRERRLMWVTHPEHLPANRLVGPEPNPESSGESSGESSAEMERDGGAAKDSSDGSVVLSPGRGARLRVVDAAGAPLAGHRVVQQAILQADAAMMLSEDQDARLCLVREFELDREGRAGLHAIGGPQRVDVFDGERRVSQAWIEGDEDTTVVVEAACEAEVTLVFADGVEATERARLCWTAISAAGRRRAIASAPAAEPGTLRFEFARPADADALELTWEDGRARSRPQTVPFPEPGECLELECIVEPGVSQWVLVVSTADEPEPLTEARVSWRWGEGDAEQVAEARHLGRGWSRAEGLPVGVELTLEVAFDGHETAVLQGYVLAAENDEGQHRVQLAAAGSLRVRALRDGAPATDLAFATWHLDRVDRPLVHRPEFDEAGWATLPGVAVGEGHVVALAEHGACTAPAAFLLRDDSDTPPIELEVEAPFAGSGHVYSGANREPLAGARVRMAVVIRDHPTATMPADPIFTDSDGAYRIDPAYGDEVTVLIDAPGHLRFDITSKLDEDGRHHFGEIYLIPIQPLALQLHDPAGGVFDGYWAAATTLGLNRDAVQVSADGSASIPSGPGREEWKLWYPGRAVDYTSAPRPLPAAPVQIEVRQSEPWDVRLLNADGAPVEADGALFAYFTWRGLNHTRMSWPGAVSQTELPSPPVGAATLLRFLENGEGGRSAYTLVAAEAGRQVVELTLSGASRRAHFTDTEGADLALANVRIHGLDAAGRLVFADAGTTDVEGYVELPVVDGVELVLFVLGPGQSTSIDHRVPPQAPGEALEFVHDAPHELLVEVFDGDERVAGETITLRADPSPWGFTFFMTERSRPARWMHLGPGEYTLTADAPGRFPLRERIVLPCAKQRVELRRTAAARLDLRTPAGDPAALARVTLQPLDPPGELDVWIADGRLAPVARTADAGGRWSIAGIPWGRYRIDVEHPAGRATSELELSPGATLEQVVELQH